MTTSTSALSMQDLLSNAAWTRRLAVSLLSDRDSADDLVQETWIAALRARPIVGPSARPWLARVLRNRAVSHRREHARRVARHERAAELGDAAAADPEALLSRVQVQRMLAELIIGLPEPARQTVLLRYYEGLTSQQIGAVMGVAAGTVRRRLMEAIDELREQLDRRHQGKRESWRLALLPLGAEAAATDPKPDVSAPATLPPRAAWLPWVAVGVSILGLVAGGVWLAKRMSGPRGGRGIGATSAAGGDGRGGGAWLTAAVTGTFESCRQVLAARRQELAAAEIVYRDRAPADVLFEEGADNPTARAALLPELERIVGDDDDVSFSLECRTWACRVREVERGYDPTRGGPYFFGVSGDAGMKSRLRRSWYLPGTATSDPISHATYTESLVHLVLKVPSGAPVVGPTPPLARPTVKRPEPTTLQACQSELRTVAERLDYVRRVNEGKMSLTERFRESEFDPTVTMDMFSVVARALHDLSGPTPEIVCRGAACRLSIPGKTVADPWRQVLERDPGFSRRISEMVVAGDALIVGVRAPGPTRENPAALTLKMSRDMLATVDLVACAARAPAATGNLHIALRFARTRPPLQPGAPPPAITVALSGPVAGTPVGPCVEEALNRVARATAPLPDSSGASVTFTRIFPLEPDAGAP